MEIAVVMGILVGVFAGLGALIGVHYLTTELSFII
jgi:hypothetical protein